MNNMWEKIAISEAKVELIDKILDDINKLPEEIQTKFGLKRKITNYSQQKFSEEKKIREALKCIQKKYPPKDDQ